jgi:hypothetical protein
MKKDHEEWVILYDKKLNSSWEVIGPFPSREVAVQFTKDRPSIFAVFNWMAVKMKSEPVDPMTNEEFVMNDGQACPYCRSEDTNRTDTDWYDRTFTEIIRCESCHSYFNKIYSLTLTGWGKSL